MHKLSVFTSKNDTLTFQIQNFFYFIGFCLMLPLPIIAQTSIITGKALDIQTKEPLIGATIELIGYKPKKVAVANEVGDFVLKNVPIGRLTLRASYLGYDQIVMPNISVTPNRSTQIILCMMESMTKMHEVTIFPKPDKDKPTNAFSTISARPLNIEEAMRYSGGRNDVARMSANFAGMVSNNDSRNDIIIRGNSPTGILWRLEGIPIPNPNHFAFLGTTGGPVSVLNPNTLSNSDFLTGAFPAGYGNVIAGVFDIGLRRGKGQNFGASAQISAFSGIEAMIEGPLKSKDAENKGSFLIAYRRSFIKFANFVGIDIGTSAVPSYQDLTFNVGFGKTSMGNFSLFGIGGTSKIGFLGKNIDSLDYFASRTRNTFNNSAIGVVGIKHSLLLNDRSCLRTVVSISTASGGYEDYDLQVSTDGNFKVNDFKEGQSDLRLSTYYNSKINKRLNLSTGLLLIRSHADTDVRTRDRTPDLDGNGLSDWWQLRCFQGTLCSSEAYVQTQYKAFPKLVLNTGLHALLFAFTNAAALEPRWALNWHHSAQHITSFGYGLHHQNQSIPVLLFEELLPNGTNQRTNRNLGFTTSQHFVLAHDIKLSIDWRIKIEAYYQKLSTVPIQTFPSSFSLLNSGSDFGTPTVGSLVNKGTGRNQGLELTVEKFFSKGWYSLITASVYDAKYKGSDDILRNTVFNGRYAANFLAGREFEFYTLNNVWFTFDTKITVAGGQYFTPIDLTASIAAGHKILKETEAFSNRYPAFFRCDLRVGVRTKSKKRNFSHSFYIDLQNVTNRQNVFSQRYINATQSIATIYQVGFFPDFLWRTTF